MCLYLYLLYIQIWRIYLGMYIIYDCMYTVYSNIQYMYTDCNSRFGVCQAHRPLYFNLLNLLLVPHAKLALSAQLWHKLFHLRWVTWKPNLFLWHESQPMSVATSLSSFQIGLQNANYLNPPTRYSPKSFLIKDWMVSVALPFMAHIRWFWDKYTLT